MSDCWGAYHTLEHEGYLHLTVNHSMQFVDPDTGAHTQTIERTWREVRGNIPRFGNKKHHLAGHLAEFIMKRRFADRAARFHEFMNLAAQLYPPHE